MMISVVVTPWNLFHHHESHVHDAHFYDDSNGLISDHVFDECDFCEFMAPHYLKSVDKSQFKAYLIECQLLLSEESSALSSVYYNYYLRGPPEIV